MIIDYNHQKIINLIKPYQLKNRRPPSSSFKIYKKYPKMVKWKYKPKNGINNGMANDVFKNFCKNKKNKNRQIKCGCFILNTDLTKIVLVHNNYVKHEKWGLPKGHREDGETYANCAKREVFEETGLSVNITDKDLKIKINNTFYFPVVMNELNVVPNDKIEIKEARWVKLSDLENTNLNRETKTMLKIKMNEIKQIIKIRYKNSF